MTVLRRFMPAITIILTLVIGGASIARIPPGHTYDVWSHTYRISAILNGSHTHHVKAQSTFHHGSDNVGGKVDWEWINYSLEHYDNWDPAVVIADTITVKDSKGADVPYNNTAINSAVTYLPQLVGFGIGKVSGLGANVTFYLAEILTLVANALCMGLAVFFLPRWRIIVGLILPVVNVHPFAISADPYIQAIAALFICMLYRATERKVSTKYLVGLSVVGVLLSMGKFVYAPLTLLLLLIPWLQSAFATSAISSGGLDADPSESAEKENSKSHHLSARTWIPVAGTCCSFIWLAVWMKLNDWYSTTPGLLPYHDMLQRKHDLMTKPSTALQAIKSIAYSIIHSQSNFNSMTDTKRIRVFWILLVILLVIILVTLCTHRMPTAQKTFWLLTYLISIGILLLTYLALWLQYTPKGFVGVPGMQYRYFMPLAPLWVLCGLVCCSAIIGRIAKPKVGRQ
ncbi:DUF2142 domain-containing protein [Bifidobacterium sp. ESL0775]|uniref:DUF2142 domain-containing protein n=1 Tax=Bifidobacterium sp. ESL0775 TaxID=2983230 RepID=UPI0023F7D97B|nr:DUF2142 domain-containing protein [Bifidobacterium sp. ESL0775]WEV68655.1 DUF2142 domain-containing protein [Bifidobacterium sp. ESL0775]